MRRKLSDAALPILVGLVAVLPETSVVGDAMARSRRPLGPFDRVRADRFASTGPLRATGGP